MKENLLVKACLDYAGNLERKELPIVATRTNSGKIFTRAGYAVQLCRSGYPDITMLINGVFYGIECKTDHRQTKEQKLVQGLIERAGGRYIIIKKISDFKALIQEALNE